MISLDLFQSARFINISMSLPKTSYIKMVDVWLLFTLLIPFLEVVKHVLPKVLNFQVLLQTYIEHMRSKIEDEKEINHHGKRVVVAVKPKTPER